MSTLEPNAPTRRVLIETGVERRDDLGFLDRGHTPRILAYVWGDQTARRRKSLFSRPPRPHRPQKCSDNASRNRLEFTETYPCFSEIRRDNGSHVPENRESPLQKRHRQRIRPCRRGLPRRR